MPTYSELLPCPFCGAEAEIKGGPYSQEKYSVWCKNLHHLEGAYSRQHMIDKWNQWAQPASGEPVAVVGSMYELFWEGPEQIAPIIKKFNINIGDKLYTRPARPDSGKPVAAINRTPITGEYEFYPCSGAVDLPVGIHKLYAEQPADGEWVSCADRLPKHNDAPFGQVWVWHDVPVSRVTLNDYMCLTSLGIDPSRLYWKPTGLTRPQPPKREQ